MTDALEFNEFNPNNPHTAIALLGARVDSLGREKEALERALEMEREERDKLDERVASMEKSFQRSAGIMMAIPVLGFIITLLLTFGKTIFLRAVVRQAVNPHSPAG